MEKNSIKNGSKAKNRTVLAVTAALMTALCCICAQISFPLPGGVPITLQTLGMCICGYFLPIVYAEASVAVYVLLGAVGVPVFSNFSGGASVLVSPTGGFIFGFFLLVASCSLSNRIKNIFIRIALGFFGIFLCHLLGVIWYSKLTGNGFLPSFMLVSLPFLIKDFASVVAACLLCTAVKKRLF